MQMKVRPQSSGSSYHIHLFYINLKRDMQTYEKMMTHPWQEMQHDSIIHQKQSQISSQVSGEGSHLNCHERKLPMESPILVRQSAVQLCSTISLTLRLYSRLFSLNILAASEFAGEFGFGSHSKDCKNRTRNVCTRKFMGTSKNGGPKTGMRKSIRP